MHFVKRHTLVAIINKSTASTNTFETEFKFDKIQMNVKSSYFTLEIKLLWLRTTVKYTHHKNGELHFLKLIKKVKRTHPILILFNPLVMY